MEVEQRSHILSISSLLLCHVCKLILAPSYCAHNRKGEAPAFSLTITMALNLLNLGFHPSTLVSPKPLKDRFVLGCSRVQQISFTESENSLIEALLGIQGRGRSSSPQQLNVVLSSIPFPIHHSPFIFLSLFFFSLSGC